MTILVRLGAAVGLVAGFLFGWDHPVHPSCVATHASSPGALTRCTSHSLQVIVLHWGVALGGGLIIGAALGIAVALVFRLSLAS